jgi:hypothetical protein
MVFNAGLVSAILIAIIITTVPYITTAFGTEPCDVTVWLLALPWAAFIIITDEIRKFLVRHYPGGQSYLLLCVTLNNSRLV